jgi:hypothetical protein
MNSKYSIIPATFLFAISSAPIILLLLKDNIHLAFPDYYFLIISNIAFLVSAISRSLVSKKIGITSSFFIHYRYSGFFVASNILFLFMIFSGETPVGENNNSDLWGLGFMNLLSMLNLYYIDFIAQSIPDNPENDLEENKNRNVAAVLEFIKPFIASVAITLLTYFIFDYESSVPNHFTVFATFFAVFCLVQHNYMKSLD